MHESTTLTFCSGTITVFRIRDILVRIRILGSIPQNNGSGFRIRTKIVSDFWNTEKCIFFIFFLGNMIRDVRSFQITDPDLVPSRIPKSKSTGSRVQIRKKLKNRLRKQVPVKGLGSPVNSHPSQHAYFLRQTHLNIKKKLRKSNES